MSCSLSTIHGLSLLVRKGSLLCALPSTRRLCACARIMTSTVRRGIVRKGKEGGSFLPFPHIPTLHLLLLRFPLQIHKRETPQSQGAHGVGCEQRPMACIARGLKDQGTPRDPNPIQLRRGIDLPTQGKDGVVFHVGAMGRRSCGTIVTSDGARPFPCIA